MPGYPAVRMPCSTPWLPRWSITAISFAATQSFTAARLAVTAAKSWHNLWVGRKNISAPINAGWHGGTATGSKSRRKPITPLYVPIAERSLKAMETKIVNTAAGTVTSSHASTPQQNRIRYQITLAVLNKLLHDEELSEEDYETAKCVLACRYNLNRNSIFR